MNVRCELDIQLLTKMYFQIEERVSRRDELNVPVSTSSLDSKDKLSFKTSSQQE